MYILLLWLVPREAAAILARAVYTIQSCNMSIQSQIRRLHVWSAVICHLHFGQNDRYLLVGTAVTRCWNRYRTKSISIWRSFEYHWWQELPGGPRRWPTVTRTGFKCDHFHAAACMELVQGNRQNGSKACSSVRHQAGSWTTLRPDRPPGTRYCRPSHSLAFHEC